MCFDYFLLDLQHETITPNIRPICRRFPEHENRAHAVDDHHHQVDHHLRCAQGFLLPRLPLGACPQRRQGGIRGNGNVKRMRNAEWGMREEELNASAQPLPNS